ncbi:MAG: PilZ domain-containing protein [Porphyrobacter sp.]|nr:PilZ domain-containing protein [Porphyrobacter sp.]
MTGVETRSVSRDSLFLLAGIRVEQEAETHRVRVRNLSDGGMMAEGGLKVRRGHRVEVELRNIGAVAGSVAWVQDNRFGIAFDEEVDSQRARRPLQGESHLPEAAILKPAWTHRAPPPPDPGKLRKV